MAEIKEGIPLKNKTHPNKLVKPINPLTRPEKNKLAALEYIDQTCHYTSKDTTRGKYIITIAVAITIDINNIIICNRCPQPNSAPLCFPSSQPSPFPFGGYLICCCPSFCPWWEYLSADTYC